MIKKWVGILVFLFSIQLGFAQLSGTYTIGATGSNYSTIGAAVSALSTSGVSGAVTFNIKSGTYNEQISITPVTGASATNTITFQKDPSASTNPIVTYAATSSVNPSTWQFVSADYIRVRNLNILATGTNYANTLRFTGLTEDILVDSCYIEGKNTTTSNTVFATVFCPNGSSNLTTNVTISNCTVKFGAYGMYFWGTDTVTNSISKLSLINNTVDSVFQYGIRVLFSDSLTINGNSVAFNKLGTPFSPRAIQIQNAKNLLEVSNNNLVMDLPLNSVVLEISKTNNHSPTPNSRVYNNMITSPNTSNKVVYGMYLTDCIDMDVSYNSVLVKSTSSSSAGLWHNGGSNSTFKNNIFKVTYSFAKPAQFATGASSPNTDYNCFDHPSSHGPNGYSSLGLWVGVANTDSNSFTASVTFTSDFDLHTADTDVAYKATPISYITTDIDGNVRKSLSDVGADEFSVADLRLSGTYTIGGTTPDYATFGAADSALDSHGVKGPVIFNVRSATFAEQISIDSIVGASATNTITFQKEPGAATNPILTFASTNTSKRHTLKFNGADYISIKNLNVVATGTYANVIVYSGNTDHIVIDSCLIEGRSGVNGAQYDLVVHGSTAADQANYCVITNSTFKNGYYALIIKGQSNTNREKGNQVINNTFTDTRLRVMDLNSQDSMQVIGNNISMTTGTFSQSGIVLFYGDGDVNISYNNIVLSSTKGAVGLQLLFVDGKSSNHVLISNNSYTNKLISAATQTENGFQFTASNYIDFYYNTASINGLNTANGNGVSISGNNYDIKNNLLSNTGGGYAISSGFMSSWTSDYNNFYATGTNLARYNNNNQTNLSSWKTATSKDVNSKSLNPSFIAIDTLKPNNGDLNNKGTPITGITTDITGAIRNVSTPDIGAYEFIGVQLPMSGTYTVGGTTPDYDSIVNAVSALKSRGVSGAVTMHIRSGTYTEQITLDSIQGTSASNTVTFMTEPSSDSMAVITFNSDFTLKFQNGVNYVSFDSLKVQTTGTANVIEFGGDNDHISFVGDSLIGYSNSGTSTLQAVVYSNSKSTYQATFTDNVILNGSYGFYIRSSSSNYLDSLNISDNEILNFKSTGIYFTYVKNSVIEGNTINSTIGSSPRGINVTYANFTNILANSIYLEASSYATGMLISRLNGSSSVRAIVANNMLSLLNASTVSSNYSSFSYFSYADVVYNSFYGKLESGSNGLVYLNTGTNSNFENNSVYNNASGAALFHTSFGNKFSTSNNNVYGNKGNNNVVGLTLASSSVSMNPQYVDEDDLHLTSAILAGTAKNYAAIATDFDGTTRSNPSYVGAHQFVPSNLDATVMELLPTYRCPGTQAISIRIKNNGLDTIKSLNYSAFMNSAQVVNSSLTNMTLLSGKDTVLDIGSFTFNKDSSYAFFAQVSSPNGGSDGMPGNDTLELDTFRTSLSGTYTIGGTTPDFANINAAIDRLVASGVCAPVVFNIRAGTYNEQLSFKQIPGVDSTNTVRFRTDPSSSSMAKVKFSNSNGYTINFSAGASYIAMDSLWLEAGSSTQKVVEFEGVTNGISFTGDSLVGSTSTGTFSGYSIIATDFSGVSVNDFSVSNCVFIGGSHSIYLTGSSSLTNPNVEIKNNSFYDFNTMGLRITTYSSGVIEGNTISSSNGTVLTGIFTASLVDIDVLSNSVLVQGSSYSGGLWLQSMSGTTGKGTTVANNMVSLPTASSHSSNGNFFSVTGKTNIEFNSFYGKSSNGSNGLVTLNGTDSSTFRNNSIYNEAEGFAITTTGNDSIDFNNVYVNDSTDGISGVKTGPNNISVDPYYTSTSDLHSTQYTLLGRGLSNSNITKDIDGATRKSRPDIGADDRTPPSLDAGIDDVLIAATCAGNNASIQARLRNGGSTSLTSTTINWEVSTNSGAFVTQTPFSYGGTLASLEDTLLTIGSFNFKADSLYVFKVYSSSPNGSSDTYALNDTIENTSNAALSGEYQIGGTGADFANLVDAVDYLHDGGMCGPVRFLVTTGNYSGQFELADFEGLSATNTLEIVADQSNSGDAEISFSASSAVSNYVIQFNNAKHITLDSLKLTSGSGTYASIISMINTNESITISNCEFVGRKGVSDAEAHALIYNDEGANTVTNSNFTDNTFTGGSFSIHLLGDANNLDSNNTISGNEFRDWSEWAVYGDYTNNMVIEDNLFENGPDHIGQETVGLRLIDCDNVKIHNNTININLSGSFYAYGIYLTGCQGQNGDSVVISNNMVSVLTTGTQGSIGIGVRIFSGSGSGVKVLHNNSLIDGPASTGGGAILVLQYAGTGSVIKNNSMVNIGAGYAFNRSNTNHTYDMDYNNLYTNGTNLVRSQNNNYSNLTAWQASGRGNDANSISIDPLYLSNTDLHTPQPTLASKGTFLSGHTTDFDGDTRSLGSVDIGADQNTFPANNAGTDSVFIASTCPGSSGAVSVRLLNMGTAQITSTTIHWEVSTNGGAFVSQTPFSFSGTLDTLADTTVSIGNLTVATGKVYEVRVYSGIVNTVADVSNQFDTTVSILGTKLSGTYTVGGTTPAFATMEDAIEALNDNGVCGPTIFNVRSGTYGGQLEIDSVVGTSSTNTITIQMEPGAATKPILTSGDHIKERNFTLSIYHTDYLTLKNLDIRTSATDSHTVVVSLTGSMGNFMLDSCDLLGAYTIGTATQCVLYNQFGFDNLMNNSTISNCKIVGGSYGVYFSGNSSTSESGNRLLKNQINGFQTTGIYSTYQDSNLISGNTVSTDAVSSSLVYLINSTFSSKTKITSNKLTFDGTSVVDGINTRLNTDTGSDSMLIANNVISMTNSGNANTVGLNSFNDKNIKIYNNTIKLTGGSDGNNRSLRHQSLYSAALIKNNILYAEKGYALYVNSGTQIGDINYNNYYTPSSNSKLAYYGSAAATLSALQSLSSNDVSSLNLDPEFVSSDTLEPTNGLLNNKGVPLAEITVDIEDSTRHASTPDIGAYEFTGNAPCVGLSGTYTVGGTTPYFANIKAAVDSLNLIGVCDTVIFNIRPGTYDAQLAISAFTNMGSGNEVIFRKEPGTSGDVVLKASGATSSLNYTVWLNGVSNLTFSNLKFDTNTTSNNRQLLLKGTSDSITVDSCYFNAKADMAIQVGSSASDKTDYFTLSNSTIYKKSGSAIQFGPGSRNTIINDSILGFTSTGISFFLNTNRYLNLSNNYIESTDAYNETTAHRYGIDFNSSGDSGIVSRNKIVIHASGRNKVYGIDSRLTDVLMSNNVIQVTGKASGVVRCFSSYPFRRSKLYHNTFLLDVTNLLGASTSDHRTFTGGNSGNGNDLKNNIFVNLGDSGSAIGLSTSTSTSDYNCIYSPNQSLSAWQTSKGWDANSDSLNPHFACDTALIPRITQLEKAGTPIAAITTDINGKTRSASTPSMGAYEYTYKCYGLAGTYTIGGTSPDYASISDAAEDLNCKGICDSVTFNIRQGTYTESIEINEIYNAGDSGSVTFQADPGNTTDVILTNSSNEYTWKFDGSEYVTIDGISIKNTGQGHGIFMEGLCNYLEITNNDIEVTRVTNQQNGAIYDTAGTASLSHNITITGNSITGGFQGVYALGVTFGASQLNWNISNNTISNFGSSAIWVTRISHSNCIGNKITGQTFLSGSASGITFQHAVKSKIERNNLKCYETTGIEVTDLSTDDSLKCTVVNNVVYSPLGTNFNATSNPLKISGTNTEVAFNTISFSNHFKDRGVQVLSYNGNNVRFRNNIVVNRDTGTAVDYATTNLPTFSNNLYYTEGDSLGVIMDTSSFNIDPRLKADTLIPGIVELEMAGELISGINVDVDSNLRSTSNPSIGAYEYTYVCDGLSGIYTINTSGTGVRNYASITAAVAGLNSLGICDSVTFNIKQGTYADRVTLEQGYNSPDSGWVTFQADPTNTADVTCSFILPNDSASGWVLDGTKNVIFRNLKFTSSSTNGQALIFMEDGVDGLIIDSCSFSGTHTIDGVSSKNGFNDYNKIGNVQVYNSTFNGCAEGLTVVSYATVAPNSANTKIYKNTFTDNLNSIHTGLLDSLEIFDNTITSTSASFGHGILAYGGLGVKIYNNNIHSGYYGIGLQGSGNTLIYNNEVYGATAAVIETYHIVPNVYTFYHNTLKSGKYEGVLLRSGVSRDFHFYNNIVVADNKAVLQIPTNTTYKGNFNSFFGNDTSSNTTLFGNPTTYQSLDTIQNKWGGDTNSVYINPRFKNDSTLIPRIADLESAGTPITGITTDIRDSTRSLTKPSIGAYEYTYVCDGLAGTYSIDPVGSGDYTSITAAVDDLNSLGICKDVVFNIKKGIYVGQLQIDDIYNAGDSGRVVFQADPLNGVNDLVEVYDTIAGTGNGLIEIAGKGYLEFNKINFKFQSASVSNSIMAFKANDEIANLTYRNCNFTRQNNSLAFNTAVNGIDSLIIDSCVFNATKIQLNGGQKFGAYASITNSDFNEAGSSIEVNFDYLNITDNTIGHDYGTGGNFTQLVQLQTDYLNYSRNIHRHKVGRHMVGLYLTSNHQFPGKMNITNNVFDLYSTVGASSPHHDMGVRTLVNSADSVFIEHNTFQMGRLAGDNNGSALFLKGGNQVVRNNNIVVEYDGFGIQSEDAITSDYNNIYTLGDTISKVNTAYYTSIAGMQVGGYDSNSVSVDPYFLSDTLLIPYRAALDNKGDYTAAYNKDILDSTRTPSNTDIGAFQFLGIKYDVRVDSIRVDTLCAGSHTISAFVKNISDSMVTDAKVSVFAKVFGGAYQDLGAVSITDTLKGGDSAWVRGGAFNFSPNVNYIIKAQIDTLNGYLDDDPSNNVTIDTVKTNVNPIAAILSAAACDGDSLKLNASGGKTYRWIGPNSFVDSIQSPKRAGVTSSFAGTYTVEVRDSNYCIDSATVTIGIDTAPKPNLPADTSICVGQTITLSAVVDPQAAYSWNNGETAPAITVDSASTYVVTMTDLKGCRGRDTVKLDVFAVPSVVFTKDPGLICTNTDSIVLDIATPKGGKYISTIVFKDSILVSAVAGSYPLTYSYIDTNGCGGSIDTVAVVKSTPTVTLSPITDYCANDTFDVITENGPKGGKFFNSLALTNLDSGFYNPSLAGKNLDTIGYAYTATNQCSDTAYRVVTINDTLSIVLSDTNFCTNQGTVLLKNAATVDSAGLSGMYSGSGALIGNNYNPLLASGKDTLQYSVTDGKGCVSNGSRVVTIDTIPTVTLPNLSICVNADNIKLTTGTPAGGNYWFGRGVRNDSLIPSLSNVGLDTIKYSYTLPGNGCSDTATNLTTVFAAPVVGFSLPDSVIKRCEDAVPVTLSGYSPLGGAFSGPGLDTSKTKFLSDSAGYGNHVITYTYTNANSCTNFATDTIAVDSLPAVSLTLFSSICVNDSARPLVGGLPIGGIYNGNGVDTAGVFNPSVAGVRAANSVSYSYVDTVTGCSNVISTSFSVDSLTPITLGLIPDFCINTGLDTLTQGSFNSGNFLYIGRGIKNDSVYDPVLATLGKDTIEYVFTNTLGCSDTLSQTINVHDTTAVSLNIPSTYQSVCKNEPAFTLSFGFPSGGYYNSLPAIVSNSFNPSLATVGSHTLVYNYVNSNSCVTSTSGAIQVDSVPVTSISSATYCLNDGNQTLKLGFPFGGKFTGPGMVNDSVFSPLLAGTGNVVIRYTYSNSSTGCTNFADTTFKVNSFPSVSLSSLSAVCENKVAFDLNAGATTGDSSSYQGVGITNDTNGTFNPLTAGVGNHTITYVGVNKATGCSNSTIQNIRVDSVPIVSLDSLADLCIDATSFKLTQGKPSSLGTGIYTGKGVNGKFYYPSVIGIGVDTLIYQFTNLKGCTASDTEIVNVHPLPVITSASWPSLCVNSDSISLTGATPVGGKYSGVYFVDTAKQKFSPDSVGVFSIRYSYTDTNKCSSFKDQSIQVRDLPDVRLGFANSLCKNISPFSVFGGTPFGSTGVYKGSGVVGNNYVPDSVQGGLDTVSYSYVDRFGCSDTAYHVVRLDSATPVTSTALPELCKGSPDINLAPYFAPVGGQYVGHNIFGSTMFVKNLSDGFYPLKYKFTDTNGCISELTDTLYIRPNPTVVISNDTAICDGESVDLKVSGGISYTWNTGHQTTAISQAPDSTKLFSVTVTNQFNCESNAGVLVTVHENYTIFTGATPSLCGSATGVGYVSTSGGKSPFQYYWSDGERNASNEGLVAGSYTVTIEDANSCQQYATVNVSDKNAPTIGLDSIRHNTCYSDINGHLALKLTNASNLAISWSNGAKLATITDLQSGVYSVRVIDTAGCTAAKSYEIKSPDEVLLSSILDLPDCDSTNGNILVSLKGGTPGYSYNWLGQSSTNDSLNGIGAGGYTLVVEDVNQCSDTFDFTINNSTRPLYKLDSIVGVSCGTTSGGIYISSIDSIQSYKWSTGPITQDLVGVSQGAYTVTLTDTSGCKSVDQFIVDPKKPVSAPICYITYDSASTYNKIVWDTNGTAGVSGYSIIRESSVKGVFFNLSQVLKGSNPEFIDSSLNTAFNVGNYSVQTFDNCKVEGDASPIHKSVLLSTEKINDKIVQLNWSAYQGLAVNGYYIFRYSTSEGFKLLDSTLAKVRSYNDFNVLKNEKSLFYFVMARTSGPCAPNGSVISNYSTDFGTGVNISIEESYSKLGYSVYPNPSRGEFKIKFESDSQSPVLLRVYDVRGKVILEKTLKDAISTESYSLKLLNVSDGMYYLQVVSDGQVSTNQIVINR